MQKGTTTISGVGSVRVLEDRDSQYRVFLVPSNRVSIHELAQVAMAAGRQALSMSNGVEAACSICKDPKTGAVFATMPNKGGRARSYPMEHGSGCPVGTVMLADLHTHYNGTGQPFPSGGDQRHARDGNMHCIVTNWTGDKMFTMRASGSGARARRSGSLPT